MYDSELTPANYAARWVDDTREYKALLDEGNLDGAGEILDNRWLHLEVRSHWRTWPLSVGPDEGLVEYRITPVAAIGKHVRIAGRVSPEGRPETALLEYALPDGRWMLAPNLDAPGCIATLYYAQALFDLET